MFSETKNIFKSSCIPSKYIKIQWYFYKYYDMLVDAFYKSLIQLLFSSFWITFWEDSVNPLWPSDVCICFSQIDDYNTIILWPILLRVIGFNYSKFGTLLIETPTYKCGFIMNNHTIYKTTGVSIHTLLSMFIKVARDSFWMTMLIRRFSATWVQCEWISLYRQAAHPGTGVFA